MASQLIPLTSNPNQTLTTSVNINGGNMTFILGLRYNEVAGYWVLTLTNATTLVIILDSVPLITGYYPTANLLGQFAYLAIGKLYIMNTTGAPGDWPDDTNLGSDFQLFWTDN